MAIQLWDVSDPTRFAEPRILPVSDGTVWSPAFTPDGRTLVASQGIDSSSVTLWDVADPRRPGLVSTLRPDSGLLFKMALSRRAPGETGRQSRGRRPARVRSERQGAGSVGLPDGARLGSHRSTAREW